MKALFFLFTTICLFSATLFAQPGKNSKANKPYVYDSLVLKGVEKTDTVKVTIYYKTEENGSKYISWLDGYSIIKTMTFPQTGAQPVFISERIVDKRFIEIIADIRKRTKEILATEW